MKAGLLTGHLFMIILGALSTLLYAQDDLEGNTDPSQLNNSGFFTLDKVDEHEHPDMENVEVIKNTNEKITRWMKEQFQIDQ